MELDNEITILRNKNYKSIYMDYWEIKNCNIE